MRANTLIAQAVAHCFKMTLPFGVAFVFLNYSDVGFGQVPQTQNSSVLAESLTNEQNNAQNETASTQPTSAEIWSNFLFGSSRPKNVAKPRFAFSSSNPFSSGLRGTSRQSFNASSATSKKQTLPFDQDARYQQSLNGRAPEVQTANAANYTGEAVSQTTEERIAELDRYLNSRRPQNSLLAARNSTSNDRQDWSATESVDSAREIASLNRSKIRQTGAEEPVKTSKIQSANYENSSRQNAKQVARQNASSNSQSQSFATRGKPVDSQPVETTLPIRPNALQISERSFVSSEVVRLPAAGSLKESQTKSTANQSQGRSQINLVSGNVNTSGSTSQATPRFAKPQSLTTSSEKTSETVQPLPTTNNTTRSKSQRQVLRSSAKFIDPRDL